MRKLSWGSSRPRKPDPDFQKEWFVDISTAAQNHFQGEVAHLQRELAKAQWGAFEARVRLEVATGLPANTSLPRKKFDALVDKAVMHAHLKEHHPQTPREEMAWCVLCQKEESIGWVKKEG